MKRDYKGKVVWITGASSGIGEASAYRFAKAGAKLILTARNQMQLTAVAQECIKLGAIDAKVLPCDVSQVEQLPALASQAWAMFDGIDLLFNNAGISQRSSTDDTQMSVIRTIMDTDFFAPVAITKAVLPLMLARKAGQIAVTTSIAGRFGFPMRCAYSSAKHALYGFFETLQAEYYQQGIRVTMVCPGRVKTNISLRALEQDGTPHGKMDAGQAGGISTTKAANVIFKALQHEKLEVLVGGKELLMVYIKRFFPQLCARLARKIKPM